LAARTYLPIDPLAGQQRTGKDAVRRSRIVYFGRKKHPCVRNFRQTEKKASRSLSNLQLSANQQVLISRSLGGQLLIKNVQKKT
jgi:hypothetical protein